jgi:hypothetical protein
VTADGATAKAIIKTTSDASANPELQLTAVARQFNLGTGGATFATAAIRSSFYIYDETASAYRMVINSAGNVGIGTSSPNSKLQVNGHLRAENSAFLAGRETAALPAHSFHDDADTGMFNVNPNILGFSTAGTERMRITSTGNVGIGVTPESWNSGHIALQVGAGSALSGDTTISRAHWSTACYQSGTSHTTGWNYQDSTNGATDLAVYNGAYEFRVAQSGTADTAISWNTAMTIANDGNVGIGVTPSSKLTVESSGSTNIVAKSTNGNGGYYNYQG